MGQNTNSRHRRNIVFRLLKAIQASGKKVFQTVEGTTNAMFGPENNPLYYLGAMTFFFLYILLISGIYIYIFYDTEVTGAYASVEYLTHTQWYLGGIMRSLHRYASDAMIVTMILHLLRRFFNDRFNGARSFSWITGVPMLWLVLITGLLGYLLVWDKLAQFIAVHTAEWVDWLPIIAEPVARNFLTNGGMTNSLFRLLVVTHLGVPLFLLAAMLLHTNRLHQPKVNLPRPLAVGTIVSLLVLAIIHPAVSQAPANLAVAPGRLHLDWFYMAVYPLMDTWSAGAVWALIGGGTIFMMLLPWLPPKRRDPAAVVDLTQCSGCNLCVMDCPYEAIRLELRTDGHPRFIHEARVIEDKCVSCGICTGSCPFSTPFRHTQKLASAIEMPHADMQHLRDITSTALQELSGERRVIVFGCDHSMDITKLGHACVVGVRLECIGMLPPSLIDYALRHGADGVFVTGCRMGDCFHRLGNKWTQQRLNDERKPLLPRKVARDRVKFFMAVEADRKTLLRELDAFCHALSAPLTREKQVHVGEGGKGA